MPLQPLEETSGRTAQPRQAVRVAICGEVNAGKSTLLNALLRAQLLPDNIGQENRPLITARHRARPGVEALYPGGHRKELRPGDDPALLAGAERIMVWSDAPQINGYELIELPLTTADEVTEDDLTLMRGADVLIWVTIASQAWRLTEKSILGRFGKALPTHGIIVVSRADKLRSEADRLKLSRRVERETAGLFDGCHFLFGARRTIAASARSGEDWARSGAPGILDMLQVFSDEIRATDSFRASARNALDALSETKLVDLSAFRAPDTAGTPLSTSGPTAPDSAPTDAGIAQTAALDAAPEAAPTTAPETMDSDLLDTVSADAGMKAPAAPPQAGDPIASPSSRVARPAGAAPAGSPPETGSERAIDRILAAEHDRSGALAADDSLEDEDPTPCPPLVLSGAGAPRADRADLDHAPAPAPIHTPAHTHAPAPATPPAPPAPVPAAMPEELADLDEPPDLPDPAVLDTLRGIAGNLPHGAVAGLLTEGASGHTPGTCWVLAGDGQRGQIAGRACRALLDRMRGAYGVSGLDTRTPEALSLSGQDVQVGMAAQPGLGTLFVLADGGQLNSGLVQNLLTRMCRAVAGP